MARLAIPKCVDQVLGEVEVDELRFCLLDVHLALPVVKVELIVEVWREQVRHTGLLGKSSWVSLDAEQGLPANLLATIRLIETLRVRKVALHVYNLPLSVNVLALVDLCVLIVDHFEHSVRILTEIEPLERL